MRARVLKLEREDEIKREIQRIGATIYGTRIMTPKGLHYLVRVEGVRTTAANIMKQEMLSLGGEVATARETLTLETERTTVLVMGTKKQFEGFLKKLSVQPFGLKGAAEEIRKAIDNYELEGRRCMDCAGREIILGQRTLIMGVLNVTPDSFSDGGRFFKLDDAIAHAERMAEEGADIIDVGGESSRPGADPVDDDEEKRRVIPVIKEIARRIDLPISIDTYKPSVAEEAIDSGASIINDITALRDPRMVDLAARGKVGVVLMHMKGTPKTMQVSPEYDDLISEIYSFLDERIEAALQGGVDRDRIMIDPGIGFGKRYEDNIEILRRLREFKSLGSPILIGTSRKSFIGKALGDLPVEERLEGTAATVAISIANGADVVRVHDVKQMKRVAVMTDAICRLKSC